MAIAQPPYRSSTYSARAVPSLGPSTAEFQAVRDDRPAPAWPPQHHKPLIALGAAAGATAVPLLIVYAFIAGDPDTARAGRTLLLSAGLVLAVLAGCCFIAMLVVRANDRAIIQGAEYGVAEVRALETLHGELQAVSTNMSATVARLEALVGHRVDAVEQVVQRDRAEVEKLAKEHAGFARAVLEQLQRIEPGVESFRQRLEAVEQRGDSARAMAEQLGVIEVAVQELLEARVVAPAEPAADDQQSEGEDRYLVGYADGLAGRVLGDGNVVALNGNGRSQPRQRDTTKPAT